jgi:uncharacterized repeat protein (TIGR01451 family)
VIYPADELGGAGRITALALDVSQVPGTMNYWTIRMKHTPLTNYTSYLWESADWTVVYQTNLSVTGTGWVMFPLTTPFDYDGTNSLMVDFSFNNSTYSSYYGYCRSTYRSSVRTMYYYTDSQYGDPLAWSGSTPSSYTTDYTPNLQLVREAGVPVPIQPTVTGPFTNGVWSGSVTAQQPATNVILRADDGDGHLGNSNPFEVAVQDDVSIAMADAPDPVSAGASLVYTLVVANSGPSAATGVTVTNLLPSQAAFVSAVSSQGTGGAELADGVGELFHPQQHGGGRQRLHRHERRFDLPARNHQPEHHSHGDRRHGH